jgi:hypothetical protein
MMLKKGAQYGLLVVKVNRRVRSRKRTVQSTMHFQVSHNIPSPLQALEAKVGTTLILLSSETWAGHGIEPAKEFEPRWISSLINGFC